MVLPLIPLLALLGIGTGTCVLVWYHDLSAAQKAEADRLASDYARRLYGTTVNRLSSEQMKNVMSRVKPHFVN